MENVFTEQKDREGYIYRSKDKNNIWLERPGGVKSYQDTSQQIFGCDLPVQRD